MPSFQRKVFGDSEMSVTDEHQDGNELSNIVVKGYGKDTVSP
jgi:hypothetical protein